MIRTSLVGLAFVVATSLGPLACSDDNGSELNEDKRIPPDVLASLPPELPADQSTLLEDGILTFAEYESAVLATIECMESDGLQVTGGLNPDGTPAPAPYLQEPYNTYFYLVSAPEGYSGSARRDCSERYSGVIISVWAAVTPPDLEGIREIWDYLAECMREGGIAVPEDATTSRIDSIGQATEAAREIYGPCQLQTEEHFHFKQQWVGLD